MSKARVGNFFEDFSVGQVIEHATPRTVTAGDVALSTPALTAAPKPWFSGSASNLTASWCWRTYSTLPSLLPSSTTMISGRPAPAAPRTASRWPSVRGRSCRPW